MFNRNEKLIPPFLKMWNENQINLCVEVFFLSFFILPPPLYNTSFFKPMCRNIFQVSIFAFYSHICSVNPIQSSFDLHVLPHSCLGSGTLVSGSSPGSPAVVVSWPSLPFVSSSHKSLFFFSCQDCAGCVESLDLAWSSYVGHNGKHDFTIGLVEQPCNLKWDRICILIN